MEPVYRCPVCHGRIALWAIQRAFTCHHCHWVLASNLPVAFSGAVTVGATIEGLLLAGLWLYLGSVSLAFGAWLAAGSLLGFAGGWLYLRQALRLVPLRPQRSAAAQAAQSGHVDRKHC
ncbi:hypothetical protein [Paucibacter soli]|uniref:hypothetical protein n=1 Tax=Paucibacter soli TaxID=3133433 RepID=UPI00309B5CE7